MIAEVTVTLAVDIPGERQREVSVWADDVLARSDQAEGWDDWLTGDFLPYVAKRVTTELEAALGFNYEARLDEGPRRATIVMKAPRWGMTIVVHGIGIRAPEQDRKELNAPQLAGPGA